MSSPCAEAGPAWHGPLCGSAAGPAACRPGGPALAQRAALAGLPSRPPEGPGRVGRAQVPGCGLGGARCRLGATPRGDYVCCGSDGGGVYVYSAAGERAAHVLQNKVRRPRARIALHGAAGPGASTSARTSAAEVRASLLVCSRLAPRGLRCLAGGCHAHASVWPGDRRPEHEGRRL